MTSARDLIVQRVLRVCPSLDEGGLDVLANMGRDCSVEELARKLRAKSIDVWRALRILGLR